MKKFRHTWKRVPALVRLPVVFVCGVTVIIAGIAMLVLPGPGWVAIFLGFAILATEFSFAERVRDWLIHNAKKVGKITKNRLRKASIPACKSDQDIS